MIKRGEKDRGREGEREEGGEQKRDRESAMNRRDKIIDNFYPCKWHVLDIMHVHCRVCPFSNSIP